MNELRNIIKLSKYFVRTEYLLVIFTTIFISIFDLFTISLLLPLMSEMVNSDSSELFFGIDILEKNLISSFIYSNLLTLTFIGFIISFILQYLFRVFRVYLMNRVFKNYNNYFIRKYNNLNFLYFKKKKLPEVFNSFNAYSEKIVNGVLDSFMTIISSSILILILFTPIMIMNTLNFFLILFLLLIILIAVYQFLKKKIIIISSQQLLSEKKKSFDINFIYNFFNYVKTNTHYKNNIIRRFFENLNLLYKASLSGSAILYLPKMIIETLIIVFIFFSFLRTDTMFIKYIPELTIYLFIFYKLFPHVISINTAFKRLKLCKFFIKNTIAEINFLEKNEEKYPQHKELIFKKSVFLRNAIFKLDKKKFFQIKFENLEFKKNEKYLLMGKSGSGKSTFANVISGLIFFNKFTIYLDHKLIKFKNLTGFRKIFSIYDGKDILIPGTINDNIVLLNSYDKKLLKFAIDKSGLSTLIDKKLLSKNFRITGNGENLSSGQRQLICIARTLYQNKNFIIFDEPTSHLDHKSTLKLIKNLVNLKDKTIILISHNPLLKKYFNKIYNFKNFKVTNER